METEHILERARALVPALRERAQHCEELRRLPDETVQAFRDAGLFRIMGPRSFGGSERGLSTLAQAVIEVGQGCGSSAWCLCILGVHHWLAGLFPEAAQRELFEHGPDVLFPATFAPTGKATVAHGGFTLSGRWSFASGVDHSTWAAVAGVVRHDQKPPIPDVRCFLVPVSDFRIDDTWFVSGLKGTGSKDIVIEDAFVPSHRVVPFAELINGFAPGTKLHEAASFRMPLFTALALIAAAPAVGIAKGARTAFIARAKQRVMAYGGGKQSEQAATKVRLSHASAQIDTAEVLLLHGISELERAVLGTSTPDLGLRVKLRRDAAFAVKLCQDAVRDLSAASGASAQYLSSPMQRALRDLSTLGTHVVFDGDAAHELYGSVAMGQSPTSFMF